MRAIQSRGAPASAKRSMRVVGQAELLHALGIPARVQHVVVELVAVDVVLDLGPELVGHVLAVEAEAHGVVQDRRHRGLDAVDGPVAVLVRATCAW